MSQAGAPSPEKVLRRVFWKLLFRGRTAQQAGKQQAKARMGLGITLFIYAVVGFLPAMFAEAPLV